jgi:Transposase DDE domain group 1
MRICTPIADRRGNVRALACEARAGLRRHYASFTYQVLSWSKPHRVVAKVESDPGDLYPRVGFIVTNLARPAERVVAFYNQRVTAEQWHQRADPVPGL